MGIEGGVWFFGQAGFKMAPRKWLVTPLQRAVGLVDEKRKRSSAEDAPCKEIPKILFSYLCIIFTLSVYKSSRQIFLHALNGIYRHYHSIPVPTQMPFIMIIIIKISFLLIHHPPELTVEYPRCENGKKQKTAHGFSNPLRWHELVI